MKKVLLTIGLIVPFLGFSQVFSSGFESQNGPISNWTLHNVDGLTPAAGVAFVNNAWVASVEEFPNNVAMSTSWYSPPGTSNDWMVSPAITLPIGTNTLYWHAKSYDPAYKESYRVYVSTTGNAVSNFTTPLLTVNGEEATWQNKNLDLSAYAGQTIYLAFQNFSNDKFLGAIDNVYIVNGTVPILNRAMGSSGATKTSVNINWTAATGVTGYDYAIVSPSTAPVLTGTVNNPTTATASVSNLTENTRYDYYVRSKNNALTGGWIGPYSFFTAQELGMGNSYNYGFDNTAAGFYNNDGWTGAWSTNASATNPQAGGQMVFSNSSEVLATPTNRWLFSKPFNLTAGQSYSISFYLRSFSSSATLNPQQSIALKVGNENISTAQTQTVWSSSTFANTTWTQYTATYTPAASGTHYFSFHHFTPGNATSVSLGLDTFNISGVLSTEEVKLDNTLTIYPNPVSEILNIKTDGKIKEISVYDMSGRKMKANLINNQIDVRNLQSGTYMIEIITTKGKSSQQFIKK